MKIYIDTFESNENGAYFLIQSGVNINHTCNEGENALIWYIKSVMFREGFGVRLCTNFLSLLVEAGIDVNCVSKDEFNPVGELIQFYRKKEIQVEILRILIGAGFELRRMNYNDIKYLEQNKVCILTVK